MKEWKIKLQLIQNLQQPGVYIPFDQLDISIAIAERLEGIYEVLAKIAEGGDKITLGPITMTAPKWLAEMYRKFDQVDLLVSNKFRELLTRVVDLEAKIAEQASAPVTSDTAQEAREVLQMIADADTGTIQVDIDDEIASSDCRHCEWMKERAKEYLESHPAPVESHQPAGDEAKWPGPVYLNSDGNDKDSGTLIIECDTDHVKRDAEVAAEIQSFADSQNAELETQMKDMSANYKNEIAELRAENEKLKTELRDYMSDSLLNAALEAEHGE